MNTATLALSHESLIIIAGIALIFFGYSAARSATPEVARGAIIAAQGAGGAAAPCAACHAYNGASDGTGAFPRIAGQSAYYLSKELRDYASGVRANAVMSAVAKALSSDEIVDVAAYYASVKAPYLPLPSAAPTLIRRGEQLASVGDEAKDLPSCNNCHGPGGAGEPPAIPYLAGQYQRYIAFQLTMWKQGFRQNSRDAMADIAKRLDEPDITAVAAYFQQVNASALAATQPMR